MSVVYIPLQQVPSQQVSVVLSDQNCIISLRQLGERQYFSLSIDGTVICSNVLLVNISKIVRAEYKGLAGDFMVVDLQGSDYPEYTGWGDRWLLLFNPDA